MDFELILPCGGIISLFLSSKELQGKLLFNKLYKEINISEDTRDYFGVCYTDKSDGGKNWILPEDKLKHINCFRTNGRITLQFEVRIFPKDPDLIFPTAESRKIFRQHMKNLITTNQMVCDNAMTCAMLDAFLVQAELGDCVDGHEEYFSKVKNIDVHAPASLPSGTPLTESQYLKTMRTYHRKLKGTSPEQADILFLSLVQKIPMYGYSIYHISDDEHNKHILALSMEGLNFIFDLCLEKFIVSQDKAIIRWCEVIYCEIEHKKIKLGYILPRNTNEIIIEKCFKIKSKYGLRGAQRFKDDFHKYKEMFSREGNTIDGRVIFTSRREASFCYSEQLPRRANTLGARMERIRSSIKKKSKISGNSIKARHHILENDL